MHNALGNTLKSFSDQVLLIDFLSQTNKKPFCLVATGAPVDGAGCSYYPTFWSNISFHGCELNLPSGFEISGQSMAPTCESLATIYAHGKTCICTAQQKAWRSQGLTALQVQSMSPISWVIHVALWLKAGLWR